MTARYAAIAILAIATMAVAPNTKPANAASFDCATATRPVEKLICSDPKLSTLDEQMAQAYADKIESLSSEGRQILKQGQRSWLQMMNAACKVPDESRSVDVTPELACVLEKYQHRIETLRADWQSGPFQLVFVERYEAFHIKADDPDIEGQLVYHEVGYPQIDAPRTPEAERWNKLIADGVQGYIDEPYMEGPLDTVDVSVYAAVNTASLELISAELGVWYYAHGMPHGQAYFEQRNVLLKTGQLVTAMDLFDDSTPWRDALLRRCLPELAERNPELELNAEHIDDTIDNAGDWKITSETLEIGFNFNDILGWGHGGDAVVIPWRALKPYLRPDLPLALKLD